MIHSHDKPRPSDFTTSDLARLRHLGWSDEALHARAQVMGILQGWLASGVVELAVMPAPPEIEPLARLAEADSPAANDAAMLLALLETGRWVAAQTLHITRNKPTLKVS
ncbi:MAG: hypothetical protein Kow0031_36970 [Anaerolineae bacterium]